MWSLSRRDELALLSVSEMLALMVVFYSTGCECWLSRKFTLNTATYLLLVYQETVPHM